MRPCFIAPFVSVAFCGCIMNSANRPPDSEGDASSLSQMHENAKICFRLANLCYDGKASEALRVIMASPDCFPCRDMLIHLLNQERYEEAGYMLSLVWAQDLVLDYSTPRASSQYSIFVNDEAQQLLSSKVMTNIQKQNMILFQEILQILDTEKENK